MAVSWRARVLVMLVMLGAVSLPVSAQPAPPAIQSASLSSATSASLNVAGYASVAFQFTGTWVATVQFEGSVDGSTYVALNATPPNSTTAVTSAAANGVWFATVAGLKFARARVSAYTSGTVVVTIQAALSGGGSGGGGGGGGSAPSGTIGAAVPATASPAAVKDNAGNLAYPSLDASGNLLVAVTGAGSGGTSSTDGAGYTAGTTAGTPTMGARDDAATTACAEDKVCIARLTSSRALMVDLSGTAANATAIKVDGSAVTQPVSGTVTANQGGAPWASNTTQLGGTAIDTNSGVKSAGTQRVVLATDQPQLTNALKVDGSAVTQPVSGTVTAAQATAANLNAEVQGDAATDAPVSGNPVQMGGRASAAAPTDVSADGDAVPAWLLRSGAQAIQPTYAGVFQSTGNGVAGTGTPRVTIASDNTAFTVNAAQSGSWSLAANQSVNLAQLAGTTTDTNSGLKSAGTLRVVLATDQPALTNKLLVTPDSVALPANQSVNVSQFGGSNTVTGTGVSGAGIPRVTVANDSNVLATQSGTWNIGTLTTITNTVPVQGTLTNNNAAPSTNNVGALVARSTAAAPSYTEGNMVTLSTDNAGALRVSGSSGGGVAQTQVRDSNNNWQDVGYYSAATQVPTYDKNNTALMQQLIGLLQQQNGYLRGALGTRIGSNGDALKIYSANAVDPCSTPNKLNVAISQTATSRLVTGQAGYRIFICSARVVAGAAEILNFTEGTGTTCGTGETAVAGSTTAANGESYAANGGFSAGGGLGAVMITVKAGNDLCLKQSGSNRLAGNVILAFAQ